MKAWLVHWLLKSQCFRSRTKGCLHGYCVIVSTTGNCAWVGAVGRVAARERGVAAGRSSNLSAGHSSGNGLWAVVANFRRLDFGGGNHSAGGNHLHREDQ